MNIAAVSSAVVRRAASWSFGFVAALVCVAALADTPATTGDEHGIAWHHAASDRDVDAAFAAARAEGKPIFVYWGAKWCPPCNQVKATLFNRQDFIERSRAFVPVYVDGDSAGAQKLGARFHVSGYPTMVLFNPQGQEVTRLPGEVEPARYSQVLTLGMNAARPVKAVLADALAGKPGLGGNDWRLLAFYSWDTDEQQLVAKNQVPSTLARLATACPASERETCLRLRLKALAARDAKAAPDNGALPAVRALLADAAASREETDMLTDYAAEITRATTKAGTPQRAQLRGAFDAALKRLEADTTLSRADRLQALAAQVDLARIDLPDDDLAKPGVKVVAAPAPKLSPALLADIRAQTARADREITDGYERQAVITAAADLLERAGLGHESDALLEANLAKSHSPYYLMSELASNAKKRGDNAAALRWYGEAFAKSEGPATRLQWGASYVGALTELAPADEASIERTTAQIWSEAATQPDAFYERSGRSLKRIVTRLQAWNQSGKHSAVLARLQGRLDTLCASPNHGSGERAACVNLLAPPAKPTA